jgi:DNA-binding NarL/FixJ family response regulator
MKQGPVRLVVADRHPVIREGVAACLSHHWNIELVGTADDARSLGRQLEVLQPDVVLLDVLVGVGNRVAYVQDLATRHPRVAMLMFMAFADMELVHELLMAGVRGCVLKQDSAHELLSAVMLASRGGVILSKALRARSPVAPPAKPCLTFRQSQVLTALALGWSSKRISLMLRISDRTVEKHYEDLRKRLRIASRGELIKFAVENLHWPRVGGLFRDAYGLPEGSPGASSAATPPAIR